MGRRNHFNHKFIVPWGKDGGEGIVREFGMDMYKLLYLKCITIKALVYSTVNSVQCYAAV